jgi:hypothetical protein
MNTRFFPYTVLCLSLVVMTACTSDSRSENTNNDNGVTEEAVDEEPSEPAAAPAFTPPAGTFSEDTEVVLSTETAGAVIHYTLDGSDPSDSSPAFDSASPILVAGDATSLTIRAIAVADGFTPSDEATGTYEIDYPVAEAASFSPPAGT